MTDEDKKLRLYINEWLHCVDNKGINCNTCPVCRFPVGNSSNLCEVLTIIFSEIIKDMREKYLGA